MTGEELFQRLACQPFQPVRLHLTDGRFFDIPSREMAVVGVNFIDIGLPVANAPEGIWGGAVRVLLKDIQQVEPLTRSSSVSSR